MRQKIVIEVITQSRMTTARRIPRTKGSSKGELRRMLPTVEGVVEEKLAVKENVSGTVVSSSIILSGVLTVVCGRPKARTKVNS